MLSKLLFSLSLAVSPLVAVSGQSYQVVSAYDYTDFDTFHTEEDYLNDFDYLLEYELRFGFFGDGEFEFDYSGENYYYYVFPIYYDIALHNDFFLGLEFFYANDFYKFYNVSCNSFSENATFLSIYNYIGNETEFSILALNSLSMSQVIEHDKVEKSNSISIYNSFYNFFTAFFPDNVVAEYHGIFTFVIVAFLLFLVFGFVFFLFRVIRRLVGFK